MIVGVDTNILLRFLLNDDGDQSPMAAAFLRAADAVVVSIVTLCEIAWVLRQTRRWRPAAIADALDLLLSDPKVKVDRALVAHGIAMLRAGGDFADGVIAADARGLGAQSFATFDRDAARRLEAAGVPVTPLN